MFDDALLESSLRRTAVLGRSHYLFSTVVGTLFFVLGLYMLPLMLAVASRRALLISTGMACVAAALYALMLCYVWEDSRLEHRRAWPWFVVTLLLNLPGFLIYLVYSAQKSGNWKRAAIPLAYVAESVLVGVLILVPLIHTQALPTKWLTSGLYIPAPPPGPPPGRPAGEAAPPKHHAAVDPYKVPPEIPPNIVTILERPEPPRGDVGAGSAVIGGLPSGLSSGPLDPVINSLLTGREALPPPPVVHTTPQQQIVHVGGVVMAALALYKPTPVYPPLAIMAHIQGTVVLQAILGKDGRVQDLKVVSGHPMLARAALDAVKTWRYQPTLLNGEPVEVLTEIDVNFKLGE